MNLIYKALAPLASLKFQERYIINGTKNDYVLPEELLNVAINLLFEQKGVSFIRSRTLNELKRAIQSCNVPEGISNSELIGNYEPWNKVRELSNTYLTEIEFNLVAWEKNEL